MTSKGAANGIAEPSLSNGQNGTKASALFELNENKDGAALQSLGGVEGAASILNTSLSNGLRTSDVAHSIATYGENKYAAHAPKSFLSCMKDNIMDPILWLLMFAATVSTVLGVAIPAQRKEHEWAEGVAIWIAVIIVNMVGSVNDYQKDQQFRKLNAQKEVFDVKVIRDGQQILIPNGKLAVGDVLKLDTGDKVSADCILVETFGLVIDEAALTGESDPISKTTASDPWVRSGTQVTEGSGTLLVVAVGVNSEWGRTLTIVSESGDDQTPLQEKLGELAGAIGKVGTAVAVACFIVLIIKWCVSNKGFPIKKVNDNGPVQFFMYAITIVVVSIPEGLPLAVTIALAYSMKKMMKDNNFVRVLAACETMGGATAICSDKTGTLTENRMTVVQGWFAGEKLDYIPEPAAMNPQVLQALMMNIALNSKAFLIDKGEGEAVEFVGNRTECALLVLMQRWGGDYVAVRRAQHDRVVQMYEFSSERKMASALVQHDADTLRLYNKGAAEWVLQRCTHMQQGAALAPMDDAARTSLLDVVTAMASTGLRCIALTYNDLPATDASRAASFFDTPPEQGLRLLAIVGIKDPVRQEVPGAVKTCTDAGIMVRMVTGDNIHTAKHIARECGILTDGTAMEGPAFRALSQEDMMAMLPKMQVLARASPKDKHTLVSTLKAMGEVVAVTGDGTNDAPALKESDVGLAMGIAGTEVAKEASDIVIMDDNFSSIVKSVLWGRSVFENIRKFLQFQLTVNLVALVMAFVGAIVGGHQPLTVMQLLWVNLIMDSLGALALATEPPHPRLLDQKPAGRTEPLINRRMAKHILVQGLYQIIVLMVFLYGFPVWFKKYEVGTKCDYFSQHCTKEAASYLKVDASTAGSLCGHLYTDTAGSCQVVNFKTDKTICADGGASCALRAQLTKLDKHLYTKYQKQEIKDREKSLSLLFNTFIFMQVANEINCRRIQDEYNIFQGFFHSPTFVIVIVVTCACQVLIINVLGSFFKVVPQDGIEWAIAIILGLLAFPISFLTRLISRLLEGRAKAAQPKAV